MLYCSVRAPIENPWMKIDVHVAGVGIEYGGRRCAPVSHYPITSGNRERSCPNSWCQEGRQKPFCRKNTVGVYAVNRSAPMSPCPTTAPNRTSTPRHPAGKAMFSDDGACLPSSRRAMIQGACPRRAKAGHNWRSTWSKPVCWCAVRSDRSNRPRRNYGFIKRRSRDLK